MFSNVILSSESLIQVVSYAIELVHERDPEVLTEIRSGIEYLASYLDPMGRDLVLPSRGARGGKHA
ncbi:MAG: hypothetical protein HC902_01590 [Calothrix sp. SM1_5_4]|nr:hypothetical protein [Calothrix sp. SM1_5_4]